MEVTRKGPVALRTAIQEAIDACSTTEQIDDIADMLDRLAEYADKVCQERLGQLP